jgi:hypothetical protein
MSRFSVFAWLKSGQHQSRGSQRPRRRKRALPRQRTVLRLEALEDRAVPSTFTVLNLADSGPGSLRAAITVANSSPGADTINFAPGLHGRPGGTPRRRDTGRRHSPERPAGSGRWRGAGKAESFLPCVLR